MSRGGKSPLRDMFSGAVWVVAARWGMRTIGLVSTVILARLLTPADFGVVALATLVVGTIEVFSETGLVIYIIRHPDPQRSHFDTVWTLQLIVGVVLAGAAFLAAPYGAAFFREPQLELIIQCLALRPLLIGLENPGIIWFRKNMTFSKDFQFLVLNKMVTFAVTVGTAVVLRNYWALVFGIVTGGLVSTLQSYRMHPYRPRFSLAEVRAVWSFSSWMLLVHLLDFFNARVDEVIIGRVRSTTEMGYYNVGSDIAATPVQELVWPMTRVWEPAFARLAHDRAALAQTFRWVVGAVATLALSVSTGLALVASDFAWIVLGPNWIPAVPVIQVLTIAAGMASLTLLFGAVLGATGDPRVQVGMGLLRAAMLLAMMLPAALYYGLAEVALGRAVATGVALLVWIVVFERVMKLPGFTILRAMGRPLIAALAMSGCVLLVQQAAPDIPVLRLPLSIAAGAASFAITLVGLWMLAGRPDSVEHAIWSWTTQKARQLRGRPTPPG